MSELGGRAERELERIVRHDPFWPAQLTVAAAIALSVDLPSNLTLSHSTWLIPAIEGALLLGLVATTPWVPARRHHQRRNVALVLVALVTASNLVNLGLLVHVLLHGAAPQRLRPHRGGRGDLGHQRAAVHGLLLGARPRRTPAPRDGRRSRRPTSCSRR